MAEPASKVPVQSEKSSWRLPQQWEPFERFRREMDRLFDDFTGGLFGRSLFDPMPFAIALGSWLIERLLKRRPRQ
jgi:HSP20 family protein